MPTYQLLGTRISPQVREIFSRAADYIQAFGWCQYTYEDSNGQVCISGAFTRVAGFTSCNPAIAVFTDRVGLSPVSWNDMRGRTKKEVVEKLRELASG